MTLLLSRNLQLASLPTKAKPGRPGTLRPPSQVVVEAGRVLYSRKPGRARRIDRDLLGDFIAVDTSKAASVERFARKWGVLGVCHHGMMPLHSWPGKLCQARTHGEMYCEPADLWATLKRQYRAALGLAAAMRLGKKGEPYEWAEIDPGELTKGNSRYRGHALQGFVNVQILRGYVMPHIVPAFAQQNAVGFDVEMQPYWNLQGCFGALAWQLALTVSATDGPVNCSACGQPFLATVRRPNPNRRAYCPPCRSDGAPLRDAARDYRRRKKAIG